MGEKGGTRKSEKTPAYDRKKMKCKESGGDSMYRRKVNLRKLTVRGRRGKGKKVK